MFPDNVYLSFFFFLLNLFLKLAREKASALDSEKGLGRTGLLMHAYDLNLSWKTSGKRQGRSTHNRVDSVADHTISHVFFVSQVYIGFSFPLAVQF